MNSMNFDMYLYRGSYDTGSLPVFEMSLKREPLIPKYTLNRRIHRGIDGEIDGVDINVGYKSSTEDIYKQFNWNLIGLLNLMDIGDEAQQIKEYLTGASSIFCDIGKVSQINADTYSVSIKVCPFNTTGFSKYFSRKLSDVINGVSTNIASHFRLYDATKPFNIYQYDRAGNLDGSILVGWTYNQHLLKKSIEEVDAYKARLIDAYWDAQGGYMLPTTSFIAAGMATSVISILYFCLICINATKQLLLRLVSIFNRSFWPVENTPFTFFAFMVSSVLVGVSLF
ncbi:MAG: hypothetical protein CTY24_02460 [Methylobacter sp.]|nr:MAG: hypothetical protein CTY24_02460 [Methylobacter sp.]